jgi:ubiquinone/menaquinone biosynthesis C-methylase UbiE
MIQEPETDARERSRNDRDHVDRVREFFDRESGKYVEQRYGTSEPGVARPYLERRAIVLEFLEGARGDALDLGCGPGVLLAPLIERCKTVAAVDVSAEMLERARAAIAGAPGSERVTFSQGSADALPFPDRSFDVVTCIGVISYWPDPAKGLSEIARVLRPGGMLILQATNILAPRELEDRLLKFPYQRLVTRITGRDIRDTADLKLKAFVPPRLDALLERAGLTPVDRSSYDFQIPLLRFVARGLSQRWAASLMRLSRAPALRFLGTGYLVRARRR